jgi:hypothetical protein
MILIEFLLAPTVPSSPAPEDARTVFRLDVEARGRTQAGVGDVVDDADGEVVLRSLLAQLVEDALTIAGVNSLDERP